MSHDTSRLVPYSCHTQRPLWPHLSVNLIGFVLFLDFEIREHSFSIFRLLVHISAVLVESSKFASFNGQAVRRNSDLVTLLPFLHRFLIWAYTNAI